MKIHEKSAQIRAKIKELKKQGFQYKLFWTVAGMKSYNFYHFMNGETTLKPSEIAKLEGYLYDTFNIEIE